LINDNLLLLVSGKTLIKLITRQKGKYHFSYDTVDEFEYSLLSDNKVSKINPSKRFITEIAYGFFRLTTEINRRFTWLPRFRVPLFSNIKQKRLFCIFMELAPRHCLPYFMSFGRKSCYFFDAWPDKHEQIREFVNYFRVDHVFVSSSQAAERLANPAGKCIYHWVPEGINPEFYKYNDYKNKDIDVLQFGRKFDKYHELIVENLASEGKIYLYSKKNEELLFPEREQFVNGLARTKISICVPCSITNPKRTGDIETMTVRYLQSMISKCLIVGHAPREMVRLFGYNPVIEINMGDPAGQLSHILENYENYIPFIEKNYRLALENHTWLTRLDQISSILYDWDYHKASRF